MTSDETPRIDTTAIILRFVDGRDDALAEYMARYKGKFVRMADRLIRKLGIDPASLDGEGAVDLAFFELCQMRDRGRLDLIKGSEDFLKLMTVVLDRVIKDEKKRSNAAKRGGAGERPRADRAASEGKVQVGDDTRPAAGDHWTEIYLNELMYDQPLVEDMVFSKIEFEEFLDKLDDDVLRTICNMRCEGYSIKEIAGRLGVVGRTVERKLATIQMIYWELNPGLEWKYGGEADPA